MSVACPAGIVMVTDGRRTARLAGDPPRFEVSSDEARKIFVCDDRFVVATYGEAQIGPTSVEDLLDAYSGPTDATCEQYAEALGRHVASLLREVSTPARGDLVKFAALEWAVSFVVAAQDADCGRVFEVKVRSGHSVVEPRLASTSSGVYPFGLTDGIDRFLKGIDRKAMKAARLKIAEGQAGDLELLGYDLIYPATLTGAIELASGLIGIQLFAQRFSLGAYARKEPRVEGCGGRMQIVTVGPRAIEWHEERAA